MFPYPEHYRVAAPPIITFAMVVWSVLGHLILGNGSPVLSTVLVLMFPLILVLHLHLVFIAEGMKRLDQAFYGFIHSALAFVVWTFCFMLISGNAFT